MRVGDAGGGGGGGDGAGTATAADAAGAVGGDPGALPADAPTPPVAGWTVAHCDIIEDAWWDARPHLLAGTERGPALWGGRGRRVK